MASDGERRRRRGAVGHGATGHGSRARATRWRLLAAAIAAIGAPGALANPSGAQVVQGVAALHQDGNRLTVTTSNGAVIHWDRFSIGAGDTTRFVQPDAASQVLNRVVGGSPSEILGRLESNGRVFLINPNGVAFGRGAQVDVGALVVSTLKLSNEDFAAGRLRFGGSAVENVTAGQIRNEGAIRTASGGTVYLVAPRIENTGLIHTPEGQVLLAAGHRVSIVNSRAPEVAWEIAAPESSAVNLGEIVARQIVLHGQVVRNAGTLQASSAVVGEDGRVVLRAQRRVEQTAAGRMNASGLDAQGRVRGGEIDVQAGEQVSLQGRVEAGAPVAGAGAATTAMLAGASIGGSTGSGSSAVSADPARPLGGNMPAATGPGSPVAWSRAPAGPSPSPPAGSAGAGPGPSVTLAREGAPTAAGSGADTIGMTNASATVVADPERVGQLAGDTGVATQAGRGHRLPGGEAAAGGGADHLPSRPLPVPPLPQPDPRHAIAGGPVGTGGRVRVLAREIVLGEGLVLDASGPAGGGTVLIGGELQGASAGGPNAQFVFMAPGARISADATREGQGGRVIVWADDSALVHGAISARGGEQGGDGGFIETSGRRYLDVARAADASAPRGRGGEWLLDPYDVEIVAGDFGSLTGGSFVPPGPGSQATIGIQVIQAALDAGSNVTITTGTSGSELGNITVNAPITVIGSGTVAPTLTLKAASTGSIALNHDVTASGSTAGLNLVLEAGKDVTFGGLTAGERRFELGGGTFDATKVGGKVVVSAAGTSPNIAAAQLTFERLRIEGGTLTVNGPTTIADFSFVSGTLGGAGSVVVSGPFSAGGGSIDLSGGQNETTFTTQGTSTVSWGPMDDGIFRLGGNRRWINEGTLRIQGSAAIELGVDDQSNPATLVNPGTLIIEGDSSTPIRVGSGFDGEAVVINQGTLRKTSANLSEISLAASSAAGTAFRNETGGTVKVDAGTLRIDRGSLDEGAYLVGAGATLAFAGVGNRTIGDLTLDGGAVEQAGSTATLTITGAFSASGTSAVKGSGLLITKAGASVAGTLSFSPDAGNPKQWENEGTLSGTGTIDMGSALLLNKGAIRPGAVGSAGTLTVKGKLEFAADSVGGGSLWLDIGGPDASDRLAVQGDVTLGGALKADLIPGYTPVDGDRIRAITGSGAVTGRFTDVQMASTLVGFAPTYELGDPVRLVHAGAGVRLFTNASPSGSRNWDNEDNWRGGLRPQAGDAVLIDASAANPVVHGSAAGTTSIGPLTVTSGSALSVTGGSLTVSGTTTLDGHLEVTLDSSAALQGAVNGSQGSLLLGSGRTVTLGGAASLGTVTLGTGATLGGTGSLTVSNQFSRVATAALGTGFSAVTLQQTEGDLSPGPLTVAGPISLSTGSGGRILIDNMVRATGSSGTISVNAGGALEVKAGEGGPAELVAAGNQTLQAASLLVSGSTASTGASLAQASIRSGATQTITITGAAELRGGSQSGRAAVIVAPVQRITVGDGLTLTGGGGSASDSRALIGGPQGGSTEPSVVDLQITVGKDLVMRAGSDGVGARIGHEGGTTANGSVRIEVAGNLSLERTAGAFEQSIIGLPEGDGGDLSLKLIATGGNISLDGPVRGGGDVRVVAEKTGDPGLGKVTIGSSGQLSSAGSGDALVIAAGSRFLNGGGTAALAAPNGRWLVYSRVDPDYHDRGGLDFGFKHYNQSYNPAVAYAGPGVGNGFLYAIAPKLTPSVSGTAAKTYDGNEVAPTAGLSASASGAIDADQVSVSVSGASFANRNAGAGKDIAVSVSLDGATSGSAPVYGYQLTSSTVTLTGAGEIQARLLTPSFTGIDKVYDGGTAAAVSPGDDRVNGDSLSLDYSAAFVSKAAGSARPITVSGITLSGADAGNYTLAAGSASTSATISPRPVSVSGVNAADKIYDGGTVATLGGSPVLVGAIPGDAVSADLSGASGQFADRRVGSAKPVTVSGLQLTGADAGNYQFSGEASTAASITARTVSAVELKAADRVYDGTVAATLSAGSVSGVLGSDDLSLDLVGAQAVFASKVVGINKPVSVSGLKLAGADAANYALASPSGQTTASITARPLTLTGVGAADRVYDGSTGATLVAGSPTLEGLITGDAVSVDLSQATARFLDRHAGVAKPVSVSGATLAGSDAGNYELAQTVASAATISPRIIGTGALVVDDRVYDGSTLATLSGGSLQGTIPGDTVALDIASGVARFADRNVGTGKPVSLTGLKLTGVDAGNYALASTDGQATASILARPLQVQFGGLDKVYDGTTAAQVAPTDDRVAGDQLTIDYVAAFADRHAGAARPIQVGSIALSGPDAANYSTPSTGSASATIGVRPLATWRAAVPGNWSNPANWDALPDRGNVAAVSIPASAEVVFDGSLQVSLESLSNAGSLELRGAGLDAAQVANTGQLLIGAGVAIDLGGRAVSGAGTLVNEGILRLADTSLSNRLDNRGTLRLSGINPLGSVSNAGIVSQRGGTTTLTGTYRQSAGVTDLSAEVAAVGTQPRLVVPAGVRIEGGRLTGEGAIVGPLEIAGGTLAPGASPGALAIDGALTLGADSRLAIELGGATPGSYDSVAATGALSLGGTLEVSSYQGFRPALTDTFDFLRGATVTGRFAEASSSDPLLFGFNYRNLRVGSAEGFVPLPADRVPLGPAEIAQAQLAGLTPTQTGAAATGSIGGAAGVGAPAGSGEDGDGPNRNAGSGTGSRAAAGAQPPVTGASVAASTMTGNESGADTGGTMQSGEPAVVRRSLLRSLDLPDAAPPEESSRTATGEVRYMRTPRPVARAPGC